MDVVHDRSTRTGDAGGVPSSMSRLTKEEPVEETRSVVRKHGCTHH